MSLNANLTANDYLAGAPLAERLRPLDFGDFVGQEEILAEGKLLRQLINQDAIPSMIFWGPPGIGKTTLARIIARQTKAEFICLPAVASGLADLRRVLREAEERCNTQQQRTILFIDEIHRWSKAQQDALLPAVEKGLVTLIGATTENPSFEVISALLSRSKVFIFRALEANEILKMLHRALADKEKGLGALAITIDEETLNFLATMAGGDGRSALNALELAVKAEAGPRQSPIFLNRDKIKAALQRTHLIYDRVGEEHYNIISALHKSMRGSDADAALYWLARMLEAGEDPLYVARRVWRFAAEDIGIADSRALLVAHAAYEACRNIGLPECNVHLAEAVVYCALAKKSNVLYTAYCRAAEDARNTSHLGVPLHLRNAPTKLMKDLNYGKDYKYNPDFDEPVEQEYLPSELKGRKYL